MIWLMKVSKIVFYASIQLSPTSLSKKHLNDCDFEGLEVATTFESLDARAESLPRASRIESQSTLEYFVYLHSERI